MYKANRTYKALKHEQKEGEDKVIERNIAFMVKRLQDTTIIPLHVKHITSTR